MDLIKPYQNEAESLPIEEELTIEGRTDRVSVYGSLERAKARPACSGRGS